MISDLTKAQAMSWLKERFGAPIPTTPERLERAVTSHAGRLKRFPAVAGGNRCLISVGENRGLLANKASVVHLDSSPVVTRQQLARSISNQRPNGRSLGR